MRAYWWPAQNFGDTLTPFVLEYLTGKPVEPAERGDSKKLLAIGSIIHLAKAGDVVWGSGSNRLRLLNGRGVEYLAVRGPITRGQIRHAVCPEVYGDPGILLPLVYAPQVEKKYRRGIVPHYVDKPTAPAPGPDELLIDIQADWKTVIDQMLSCESIIASSLHGVIAAEAYGIPATWAVWGTKIIGGPLKYHDYFLGTGRRVHQPDEPLPPIPDLAARQEALIEAFYKRFPLAS